MTKRVLITIWLVRNVQFLERPGLSGVPGQFGAEFIQAYANQFGIKIEPANYAEQIEQDGDVKTSPPSTKSRRASSSQLSPRAPMVFLDYS